MPVRGHDAAQPLDSEILLARGFGGSQPCYSLLLPRPPLSHFWPPSRAPGCEGRGRDGWCVGAKERDGGGGMSWGALARPAYPVFMARKPPSPSLSPRSHTCCQTHCQAFGTAFAPAPFFAGRALRKYQNEFSFTFPDLFSILIHILNSCVKRNL